MFACLRKGVDAVNNYIVMLIGRLPLVSLLFVLSGYVSPAWANDILYFYNLALKNDPQLRGSQYDHMASRETLRQAYAALYPQIFADVNYTSTNQDITSSDNKVYSVGQMTYDSQTYSVNLTQPLFRYSSFMAVGQARVILKRADLELEKAKQDLILRVAEAYMEVLSSRDKLAAVVAEETALDSHYERAKWRADKGMAPITDLYDAEARLAAVKAQRIEAEYVVKDSYQALAEMCGVAVLETKQLKEEIPLTPPFPASIDNWIDAALKQNLEILIQKSKAEIADREISRQKAAHYPTLDFQADYVMKDTTGTLFGGGSSTQTYDLMIKLNIPIYEGGLTTSKTRESANLYQSAVQAIMKQSRAAERKARSTYNGVLSASTRVVAMKKSVEAQQTVVEAKEEGFKAGLFVGIAVLDAMQDLYKYKKEYSQARNDYLLNTVRLKHTAGTLGEDDLRQINSLLQ